MDEMSLSVADEVETFLRRCALSEETAGHVRVVLCAMPAEVRGGLLSDQQFVLTEWDNAGGRPAMFAVPAPGRTPVRAVVLKRRMWRRDTGFVRWVIAHELAHAYLGNRGRFEGEDPEHAADALAAEWGFSRP